MLHTILNFSLFLSLVAFVSGCEKKAELHFNQKELIKEKCSQCHNLDLPPQSFENETAPPMMAVAFHVKSFMTVNDESNRIPKAIKFVKSYVMNPSRDKSLCDEASLKSYGLMPSQKENVGEEELQAIAEYMFSHYTQKNLNEAQAIKNRLKAMPKGERLALKNNCITCHHLDKHIVGPSLEEIAVRYKDKSNVMKKSIQEGSSKKWKNSHNAVMPAFKKLKKEEIESIVEWILILSS